MLAGRREAGGINDVRERAAPEGDAVGETLRFEVVEVVARVETDGGEGHAFAVAWRELGKGKGAELF